MASEPNKYINMLAMHGTCPYKEKEVNIIKINQLIQFK